MNYCCAAGNCDACIARYKRIHAQNRQRERRLRRYGPPPPPSRQDTVIDEVVKVFEAPK